MPGRVDHVVNFDFPMNAVDYLHRTGRTARAGAPGAITSLVTRRDQVPFVNRQGHVWLWHCYNGMLSREQRHICSKTAMQGRAQQGSSMPVRMHC